ncbi:uncharacterized protein PV06_07151 [Exophiala oligosperma]|uniref:DASH complex subunit ASK1 n=2 Tax=Chaetothyriales TaxID=34395 RepID=A0A0D2DEZ8_9EURO|nr:uncharacterized protein PV06_07151 [Exophiala oligosperma]KAJ9630085.1 DASH complex subunit ask1 [Knufia peltigerae]KIW41608.1 hypothetical protein PV06_07151 [Exophiala oligosperma]
MSRISSTAQPRALTLTEELEKLEQSITLTLQEIDHNFSRAHRIVTSSILPIVEQYATHSKDVWEGSRFWKQFFESSANVSLSGYEERPSQFETTEEEITDNTVTEESNATTHTTLETSESYETPAAQHISTDSIQDLDLSNLTMSPSHSTPRPPRPQQPNFADYPSPYEALRREVNSTTVVDATSLTQTAMPETPGRPVFPIDSIARTPESSPYLPPQPTSIPRPSTARKKTDPVLHHVLDRTYRVQATPMTASRYTNVQPKSAARLFTTTGRQNTNVDPTLSSSPVAPPELHPEIFSSPERKARIPGVSVLSPSKHKGEKPSAPARTRGIWDSDDDDLDDEIDFGQSPPKTMQFHVPQNRLLKTPAKEASQRIVDDILTRAGMDFEDEEIDFSRELETEALDVGVASPSVVRAAANIEDETF